MKTKYYGYLIVIVIGILLIYHSLWIYAKVIKINKLFSLLILQPFLKSNTWLDKLFPDKYWALAIPAYGASLTYSFSFIFLGWIFILSYKEQEEDNKEITKNKNDEVQHNKIE